MRIGRREFITLLGGAAAWPLAALAQQAVPVIAFVSGGSADVSVDRVRAFRQGLVESGRAEGQNVSIEYHWLNGEYGHLDSLMGDFAKRRVSAGQGVLVPGGLILTAAHVVDWTPTGSMALGDNAEFVQKIETARGRQLLVYPLAVEPVADLAVLGALDDQWHPDGAEAFEQFREATRPVRLATAELPFDERKMGPGVITVDGRKVSSDLTVRTYRPIPAHVLAHTGQWISGRVRQGGADAHKLWFDPYSEPIEGGTSGGPVVAEEDGLLLGVVSFTSTGTGAGRGGMIPRPHLAAPVWLVPRMLDAPAATATAMAPR